MVKGFFSALRDTAAKIGHCDPNWLKNEEEQRFNTVEGGTSGPELILLHGLFGALSNWDDVFPLFEKFARPIALQFPILTAHRSEVKVRALAAYTDYFIRTRNLEPVTLCGNSLGGHVALRFCLARPEAVDCLILAGTSGLYEHTVESVPVRPDKKFIKEQMGGVFFNKKFVTEEAISEMLQILSNRMNVLNIIHAARSAKKDNMLHLLKEIKAPTLLLWGENDQVTPLDVAEVFQKNIPNSTLVSVKNCGHAPMIEQPVWFAEEVDKFLKANSRYYKKKT